LLRFQEIATKKPFARRRLNTIVARRSSALLTAPSVAKKLFWPFIGQFAAIFFGKKCRVSGNYVKKNGRPCPKGRQLISVQNVCVDAELHSQMQIWKLLQRLFVFWSNTQREERDGTEQGV